MKPSGMAQMLKGVIKLDRSGVESFNIGSCVRAVFLAWLLSCSITIRLHHALNER